MAAAPQPLPLSRRVRADAPLRRPALWRGLSGFVLWCAVAGQARAQDPELRLDTSSIADPLGKVHLDATGPIGLILIGLAIFAVTIAILHVRARRLWNEQFEAQRATIADLQMKVERATLFVGAEPQFFVSWDGPGGVPELEGDASILGEGMTPGRVLDFPAWLGTDQAQALSRAVEQLRGSGKGFKLQVTARAGALVEVDGQPVSGRVVMRLRAVTGERLSVVRATEKAMRLEDLLAGLKTMLDAIPQPIWLRGRDGQLRWTNAAYIQAVEGKDADDVLRRRVDLLERQTIEAIGAARAEQRAYHDTVQVVVAGDRRMMDVYDIATHEGVSGGIALDVTDLERTRRDFEEQSAAHVRTLDQLTTAVALFDRNQRLTFTNRAFNALWQIEQGILASRPTDMQLFDRLRADGKLPEQSDFRAWKQGLQQSINANETLEDVWLLPSGRSLRVVTSPSAVGGVTYLFDDITEQMHLAQDYHRLASMQGETLDALAEGVAVFGSNGRLQLHNPAFAGLWGMPDTALADGPHVDEVARGCSVEVQPVWQQIRTEVCGLPEERVMRAFETTTSAGKVLQLMLSPLPEGASLLTVRDITSTVRIASVLSERNKALESAAQFKNEFIHNVSFELRMPLTSVVGIAQLLATGTVGPLNERQRGYANDLMRASDSILALINDILDLASIDSNRLDLKIGRVDLFRSIEEASAGLKDRLGGAGVNLRLVIAQNTGALLGDERRVRHILFNLLANAVASSDPGDTVILQAERNGDRIVMRILDRGRLSGGTTLGGVDEAGRRTERGQSMRLSIVRSLVELHHGHLTVESRPDGKRQVLCSLPAAPADESKATG